MQSAWVTGESKVRHPYSRYRTWRLANLRQLLFSFTTKVPTYDTSIIHHSVDIYYQSSSGQGAKAATDAGMGKGTMPTQKHFAHYFPSMFLGEVLTYAYVHQYSLHERNPAPIFRKTWYPCKLWRLSHDADWLQPVAQPLPTPAGLWHYGRVRG